MPSPVPTSYLRYQNGTWNPDSGLHPGRYIRIPKMGIRSEHTRSTSATLPRLNLGSHQALPRIRGVLQYTYPDSGGVNKTFTPSAYPKPYKSANVLFDITCVYWFFLTYIPSNVGFCQVVYISRCHVLTSSIYSQILAFINTVHMENPVDHTTTKPHPHYIPTCCQMSYSCCVPIFPWQQIIHFCISNLRFYVIFV